MIPNQSAAANCRVFYSTGTRGAPKIGRIQRIDLVQYLVHIRQIHTRDEMQTSVSDAKAQLTELVRQAEAGEEIILTRHGQPVVRLVPIRRIVDREQRRRLLDEVQASAAEQATVGESAARSQDFLYDEDGLPR